MSRDRDIYLSLEERANLANSLLRSTGGYGLFISIHMNASPLKSKRGVEVYFISDKVVDSEARETLAFENAFIDKKELQRARELEKVIGKIRSVALMEESRILSEKVANRLRSVDEGLKIKGGPFYVIKYIPVPSVLLEVEYISNPESAKLLVDETYQKRIAELVSDGILDFISAYNQTQGFTFSKN
jgi:N-acetylmuramoyl-L-alanine amidase